MKAISKLSILLMSVSLLLLMTFLNVQVGYSDGWVNQTLNITPAISCSISKTSLGFGVYGNPCTAGNITAGTNGCPIGQDESSAPGPNAVNVTAGAGNTAYMKVNLYATDWATSSGQSITTDTNEYYHVQNTTNAGSPPFAIDTAMPESTTQSDTQLGAGDKSFYWLNITVPAAQWAGTYSSNLTFICAISGL